MKFVDGQGVALPYTGADGVTYEAGDFKPVWAGLQKKLNFTISDGTTATSTDIKGAFTEYLSKGFKGNNGTVLNIAQGNSDQIITEGTTNGTIVDLSQYLTSMPNFSKFLDNHPAVKKTIVDSSGAMYYAPYFDGFDDIERMLMVRQDWVEKLLDGDLPTTLDTAKTITSAYTGYMPSSLNASIKVMKADMSGTETVTKKYDAGKGIIPVQNALSTLNGTTLVTALRNYIDTTYNNYYGTKRSLLFCGANSAYDADEMVALFRCVRTNPAFLTGDSAKDMVPFFTRASTNDRTADLWRLTQFWGVRGGESRNNFLYVGSDGKLVDSRGTEEMKTAVGYLNEMYQEGLILTDFTTSGAVTAKSSDFRGGLLQGDRGFATYDYNQTTTIYNDDTTCAALDGGKFLFASVLPAVADWRGDGTYFHYTESWRSVKTQGWFITKATVDDTDVFNRCLTLFDFLYSDVGNRMMSYGTDGYLAKNSDGSYKTIDYQGKQVPVLSDACKNELTTLAKGNYTNYYRYWVGATFPVGYVKEQGMEYQCVSSKATASLDIVNKAIELGVLEHVNFKTDNTDHLYDIIPTTISFSKAEQTLLSSNYTSLNTEFDMSKDKSCVWSQIVMKGFGTYDTFDFSSANYVTTVNDTLNLKSWLSIYQDGYARMGL